MTEIILMSDPRVTQVPLAECGEPLGEVAQEPALHLDPRERDPDRRYSRLRVGVLRRLQHAAASLPAGVGLLVIEGHRPIAEQERRFAAYADRLRAAGVVEADELHARVSAFVAPVQVAPHCAGAAVDLTLTDAAGAELDMGGPVNGHRAGEEATCPMDAPGLTATATRHRRLLAHTMQGAGFVNYPTEWWHWSYGDRYWALRTAAPAAIYGPV